MVLIWQKWWISLAYCSLILRLIYAGENIPLSCAGHPWVQIDGVAPDRPLDSAVLSRLKQFSAMNKLKKMAIRVSTFLYLSIC